MADDIHLRKYGITPDTTFGDFLRKHAGKKMLRPQLDWIVDSNGDIPMDFIGRFEQLEEDFPKISSHLGSIELEFDSTKSQPPVSSWFDDELNRLIENVYRREIELFDFSLERHDSAPVREDLPLVESP